MPSVPDPRARRSKKQPLVLHRVYEPDRERQVQAILRMLGVDPKDYPPGPRPADPRSEEDGDAR